jgi:hypothetical protein
VKRGKVSAEVEVAGEGDGIYRVRSGGTEQRLELREGPAGVLDVRCDGRHHGVAFRRAGKGCDVALHGQLYSFQIAPGEDA